MAILQNDWAPLLAPEFDKPYYRELRAFLAKEYETGTIYPEKHNIFNALHQTPYGQIKAVILGQDPYHGPGQAHGLSFSVKRGVPAPPSLKNILKELHAELGCPIPRHGNLSHWAEQGVLLLNAVLTVREGQPNSHQGKGWEIFTDRVIELVNEGPRRVAFLLWGSHAQAKLPIIDTDKHLIIRSPHPSPLSAHRGFFGSRPFSRTNEFLREIGETGVDWKLPD